MSSSLLLSLFPAQARRSQPLEADEVKGRDAKVEMSELSYKCEALAFSKD